MKAYPSHYNEWLILISIVSDQLLICKFAVFTCFYFIFTDGSRDLPCLLARSLSRPNSSYIVQTWCLWLGTLLFGYQAVAYYNVVAYKRWSRKRRFHCVNIAAPSLFLLFVTCIHFSIFPSCAQMWPGFGGHLSFLPQIRTICSEFFSCHLLDHK